MIVVPDTIQYVVGVDEAGRGPLAGPMVVGAVMAPRNQDIVADLPGLADSKVLTEAVRERLYNQCVTLHRAHVIRYARTFVSARLIDRDGVTCCLRRGVGRVLRALDVSSENTYIVLDGNLGAPDVFLQETIVKGDASEPLISIASVVAKVERDRRMKRYAKRWPEYGFERHKGYGTHEHRKAIRQYGCCVLHRERFLKRIV